MSDWKRFAVWIGIVAWCFFSLAFDVRASNTIIIKKKAVASVAGGGGLTPPAINLVASGSAAKVTGPTVSTDSFSPTAGGRVYLFAWAEADNHTAPVTPWGVTVSAGVADAWTKVGETDEVPWAGETAYDCRGALFACTPTAGARTLTIDANTESTVDYYYAWVIVEVVGGDFDPADAIAQAIVLFAESEGDSDSESGAISLGSNPSASNYVIVLGAKSHDTNGAVSVPTDYIQLVNNTTSWNSSFAFYRTGTTSPTATFSDLGEDVGAFGAAIIEIKVE